jgi:hypothetical protein
MGREQMLTEVLYLHNVECDSYELMHNIRDFPLPQVYFLQKATDEQTGVIMMEDLSETAIVTGFFRSITPELCLNFARHLADLQTYFELMDHNQWLGRFQRNIYTRVDLVESEKSGLYPVVEYNNGGMSKVFTCLLSLFRTSRTGSILLGDRLQCFFVLYSR